MKITRIAAYGLELPFRDGPYRCRNRAEDGLTSTIIEIETDAGLSGWGEIAPLGAFYSEAFTGSVRAGIEILAPDLIGQDPREVRKVTALMDAAMAGQADVKTPIDMALWDLVGKAADLPLAECLGGRFGIDVPLYRSVSQADTAAMVDRAGQYVEEGYGRLQVKVGADPMTDSEKLAAIADAVGPDVTLYCDANGAWSTLDALRFVEATRSIDYVLEQPCASYAECLVLRRQCGKPFVLDESVDSLAALLRIHADGAADGVTIKISRFGGLTRTRQIRDLAVDLGLMVVVEDTGGAEIDTAAIAHLSLSTPEDRRGHTVDFHNWVTISNADGFPPVRDGRMSAPRAPGLGVTPRKESFGPPLLDLGG